MNLKLPYDLNSAVKVDKGRKININALLLSAIE